MELDSVTIDLSGKMPKLNGKAIRTKRELMQLLGDDEQRIACLEKEYTYAELVENLTYVLECGRGIKIVPKVIK